MSKKDLDVIKIKFEKQLKGYTFFNQKTHTSKKLKTNFLFKYVKKIDNIYKITRGGRITEVMDDKDKKNKAYKIKFKTTNGGILQLLVKDKPHIFLFYKQKSDAEIKAEGRQAWFDLMTDFEKRKYKEYGRQRKYEFYDWYYARHPDRDKRKKTKKTPIKKKTAKSKSRKKRVVKKKTTSSKRTKKIVRKRRT